MIRTVQDLRRALDAYPDDKPVMIYSHAFEEWRSVDLCDDGGDDPYLRISEYSSPRDTCTPAYIEYMMIMSKQFNEEIDRLLKSRGRKSLAERRAENGGDHG